MAVFKVEKNKDYTVMSNYHLRDKKLSYKAKGLLSFMLSLPEDWDYSMNGLCKISKESIKAIRSILHELEENRYLIRKKQQNEKGQFNYEYLIYETPYTPLGDMDKGHIPNGTQINTNKININKQIDKDDKTLSSFFCEQNHNRLTLELIDRGYIQKDDIQIFYYDNLFNELLVDNTYNDLITIIHYIIPRVISRNFKDEYDKPIENKYGYFKESIYNNIRKLNSFLDPLWE